MEVIMYQCKPITKKIEGVERVLKEKQNYIKQKQNTSYVSGKRKDQKKYKLGGYLNRPSEYFPTLRSRKRKRRNELEVHNRIKNT